MLANLPRRTCASTEFKWSSLVQSIFTQPGKFATVRAIRDSDGLGTLRFADRPFCWLWELLEIVCLSSDRVNQTLLLLSALACLCAAGCQPLPGTMSPGFGSRLGMGPQNRAIGNSAFQSVGFGESAYGRVAYGPSVSIPGLVSPNGTTIAGGPTGGTTIQWDLNQANQPAAAGAAATSPVSLDSAYAQQLARLNADNTELYRQLAATQQQLKTIQDSNVGLEQQVLTQRTQLAQFQRLNEEAQQRLQVMQASGPTGSGFQGAVLRGNNSLTQNMNQLQVPGVSVAADGDVIRVTIPSDSLFQPGSYDFQPNATFMLNQLAGSIRQYYTGQIVGIEAHGDPSSQGASPVSQHQLTANQALALMNYLTNNQQLPAQQLLVMGYGSNRPRFSNATPQGQAANRRIELVVYPDRF